ncbi:nucleoside 2-deoxyribosyltransferase domain-containing protein [Actinoplanes sp. NPDC051513]|uniref:nucleoside 2-deoxyribosyltransferase domain-containing protein n=1 Tax=Actinoplanes sp. NPDC051513 TaxID=3363908 RepID=UPI0037A87617
MIYVEAPAALERTTKPVLFLAGGITGCPDWQAGVLELLGAADIVVANPRRANFPIHDPGAAYEQIRWEFELLRRADAVLFWFAGGPSLQPIALYELGAHAANPAKRIAVGADPGYARRPDVLIQLGLVRPGLTVHDDLGDVVADAVAHLDHAGLR